MSKEILHIKNMVCPRCITAVEDTLYKLEIKFSYVKLGEAIVENDNIDYSSLNYELKIIGFELIQNKNEQIVENIKTSIIDFIHHNKEESLDISFSDFLSKEIGYEYSHISSIFSKTEKITIEKFIILQKIEKVKELISYGELNFSEIAFSLNYSSASHLSKQFKDITGYTLSEYKKSSNRNRKTLDKI